MRRFSRGELAAPPLGFFFFFALYFILKLYLMLLYEKEEGQRADPISLMCKCLIYYACIRDKL